MIATIGKRNNGRQRETILWLTSFKNARIGRAQPECPDF